MRLRAHHLLCQRGFQGYGYNEAFVSRFTEIVSSLEDRASEVLIVAGPDDICETCPHFDGNVCAKGEGKAAGHDESVAAFLGIHGGSVLDCLELNRVLDRVTPEDIKRLCAECEWLGHGYCLDAFGGRRAAGGGQEV